MCEHVLEIVLGNGDNGGILRRHSHCGHTSDHGSALSELPQPNKELRRARASGRPANRCWPAAGTASATHDPKRGCSELEYRSARRNEGLAAVNNPKHYRHGADIFAEQLEADTIAELRHKHPRRLTDRKIEFAVLCVVFLRLDTFSGVRYGNQVVRSALPGLRSSQATL